MTKEEYLIYREQEEIPVSLYYAYYLEKRDISKELINIIDFGQYFDIFLAHCQGKIVMTSAGQRFVGMDNILKKIYTHFNQKFKV